MKLEGLAEISSNLSNNYSKIYQLNFVAGKGKCETIVNYCHVGEFVALINKHLPS